MNWDKDSLIQKSKIFFGKAFVEDRENIFFGFFCSIGLELLIRASLSKISPTILAEKDENQLNILYACGKELTHSPKSILTAKAIEIACKIYPDLISYQKTMQAIINRRNEEAHTGAMAFIEYPVDAWLPQFYKICKSLATILEISLEELFGVETAAEATKIINEDDDTIKKKVLDRISRRKSVFEEEHPNGLDENDPAYIKNENDCEIMPYLGYHKCTCPVCGYSGFLSGQTVGLQNVEMSEDMIIVRQNVVPDKFECGVCKLKLNSFAEIKAAGLQIHITRRTKYLPEDYYGFNNVVDVSDDDIPWEAYDNE